jgi:hypothetical protein
LVTNQERGDHSFSFSASLNIQMKSNSYLNKLRVYRAVLVVKILTLAMLRVNILEPYALKSKHNLETLLKPTNDWLLYNLKKHS